MDGKGRALDNIFVERLRRSVKYEEVYLKDYRTMKEAQEGLDRYFEYYNLKRPHQSLNYRKPHEVHFGGWGLYPIPRQGLLAFCKPLCDKGEYYEKKLRRYKFKKSHFLS